MTNTTRPLFDTPVTPRVLAARAAHTADTTTPERVIDVPAWVAIPTALALAGALLLGGAAIGRASAPERVVTHTVVHTVPAVGGVPLCGSRDAGGVIDTHCLAFIRWNGKGYTIDQW